MAVRPMFRMFALTAATGILAAGGVAGTAQAAGAPVAEPAPDAAARITQAPPVTVGANDHYQGHVISRTGLYVRNGPSTGYRTLPPPVPGGAVIRIQCKVRGQVIGGNPYWYKLSDPRFARGYVTAHYVDNIGKAPHFCSGTTAQKSSQNETVQRRLLLPRG